MDLSYSCFSLHFSEVQWYRAFLCTLCLSICPWASYFLKSLLSICMILPGFCSSLPPFKIYFFLWHFTIALWILSPSLWGAFIFCSSLLLLCRSIIIWYSTILFSFVSVFLWFTYIILSVIYGFRSSIEILVHLDSTFANSVRKGSLLINFFACEQISQLYLLTRISSLHITLFVFPFFVCVD